MAPHSSTLSWRIPGMGDPGGLPSVGSHRVGHDWCDLATYLPTGLRCWVDVKMNVERLQSVSSNDRCVWNLSEVLLRFHRFRVFIFHVSSSVAEYKRSHCSLGNLPQTNVLKNFWRKLSYLAGGKYTTFYIIISLYCGIKVNICITF